MRFRENKRSAAARIKCFHGIKAINNAGIGFTDYDCHMIAGSMWLTERLPKGNWSSARAGATLALNAWANRTVVVDFSYATMTLT
jgi:hypothetical protein